MARPQSAPKMLFEVKTGALELLNHILARSGDIGLSMVRDICM